MAWLRKKADPISERARALESEIASLESQIKKLDAKLNREQAQPRVVIETRSVRNQAAAEPVFEDVKQEALTARPEQPSRAELYNELGVRKFDLPGVLRRIRGSFQGPTASNPKLVSYLAAGGSQGLSPLRREKRVARNRFIVLVSVLFLVLLGILIVFVRNN